MFETLFYSKGLGLAEEWIPILVRKLKKIRAQKKGEFDRLVDMTSGTDPEHLAEFYIEPDIQLKDPATHRDSTWVVDAKREPFRPHINLFLENECTIKEGQHVLFLLGGAGMGKTTALVMLYMSQFCEFWPGSVRFEILKLGKSTLEDLKKIENPTKTVLLLDSLDEDPLAYDNVDERLKEVLDATRKFRHVLLTCRTQFFPDPSSETAGLLSERFAQLVVAGYECNLMYMAPFSKEQSKHYLQKKYPFWNRKRLLSLVTGRSLRGRAWELVESMGSLSMRPLLLAHIEVLMSKEIDAENIAAVFECLVSSWISREAGKLRRELGKDVSTEELRSICEELAVYLHSKNQRHASREEIRAKISISALNTLTAFDVGGRSLLNRLSGGSFQFAHKSIQDYLFCFRIREQDRHRLVELNAEQTAFWRGLVDMEISRRTGRSRGMLVAAEPDIGLNVIWDLRGTELSGANLKEAELRRAKLEKAKLQETRLQRANLQGADLQGANLQGADLGNAHLRWTDLRETDLRGANLRGGEPPGGGSPRSGSPRGRFRRGEFRNRGSPRGEGGQGA